MSSKIDPWDDDEKPPRWAGEQAGCAMAAVVGVIGMALLAGFFLVAWWIFTGS